jgi:hypothetical protein
MSGLLSKTHRYFFVVKAAREILAGNETSPKTMLSDSEKPSRLVVLQYLQDLLEDVLRTDDGLDARKDYKPFGDVDVFEAKDVSLNLLDVRDIFEAAMRVVRSHAEAINTFSFTSQSEKRMREIYDVDKKIIPRYRTEAISEMRRSTSRDLIYLETCQRMFSSPEIGKKLDEFKKLMGCINGCLSEEAYSMIYYERVVSAQREVDSAGNVDQRSLYERFRLDDFNALAAKGGSIPKVLGELKDLFDSSETVERTKDWTNRAKNTTSSVGDVSSNRRNGKRDLIPDLFTGRHEGCHPRSTQEECSSVSDVKDTQSLGLQ